MSASNKGRNEKEEGFASIVIAIVLVLVLSLLTVGFAQLMTKEEQSALQKHLSNQAYYAAESGVNQAAEAINQGYNQIKSTCGPVPAGSVPPGAAWGPYLDSSNYGEVGSSGSGISFTCLLINPFPLDLQYGSIDTVQSKVVEITGVDASNNPTPIKALNIGWQDSSGGTSFVAAGQNFDTAANWPYTGVLRIGLTPLADGFIDRTNLINSTFTAFLYPNKNGGACNASNVVTTCPTFSYGSGSGSVSGGGDGGTAPGPIINGNCNTGSTPRYCNVEITALGQENYLLDMRSIYTPTRVTVQALGYNGQFLRISNAQTLVDSTGKAQDVLRRIQVRIPTHNNYPHTDYDLQSMSGICKQLQVMPQSAGSSTNGCDPATP